MRPAKLRLGAFALSVLLQACTDDEVALPADVLTPPVSLEDSLLYVTSETDGEEGASALLLDVDEGSVVRSALPGGPAHAQPRNGHPGQALVLTEGKPASLDEGKARDAVQSRVLIFERSGEIKRFELSGRYAKLAVSDDGRFAIAYAPSGAWSSADSIAVIDLDHAADGARIPSTTLRALDGQGPSAVAFAPATSERSLAVLVMTDAINIIDLEHPDLPDKVLPLKLPNTAAALRAKKVLFRGDHCFVQADRSNDVLVVRFEDDDSAIGFRASLSTLGTENIVQDIVLLDGGSAPRLLAVGEGTLRIIDTISGDSESSGTTALFTAAHVFRGTSPFDKEVRPRGLLYAANSNRLGFVDLQEELPGNERSVDLLTLSSPLASIQLSTTQTLAVVAQRDGKLSVVDLEERTVSSLHTEGTITNLVLDERPGVDRVWVLMHQGLGAIDLDERTPQQILLEREATYIVPLLGEAPRIAVGQRERSGDVLLFDAERPSRSSAREIFGFLYNRFLD